MFSNSFPPHIVCMQHTERSQIVCTLVCSGMAWRMIVGFIYVLPFDCGTTLMFTVMWSNKGFSLKMVLPQFPFVETHWHDRITSCCNLDDEQFGSAHVIDDQCFDICWIGFSMLIVKKFTPKSKQMLSTK